MFKLVLFNLVLLLLMQQQYGRYKQAREECLVERDKDMILLSMDVCQDTDQRYRFQNRVDCIGAEKRLLLSVWECTIDKWIVQSHVAELYFRMTSSYWNLMGLVLPLAFWWMWLWSKRRSESHVMDRMEYIFDRYNRNVKAIECK
jgi:hypothetical protein